MNPIPLGIYHHYKGNQYEVIGFARHSETLEDNLPDSKQMLSVFRNDDVVRDPIIAPKRIPRIKIIMERLP